MLGLGARYDEDSAFTAQKKFCGENYRNFKYRYIGMKSGKPDRGGKIDKKKNCTSRKKIVRAGRPAVALGTDSAARIEARAVKIYWDGAKCFI